MANKKFSDLTVTTTLAAADLFAIENATGNSRKITAGNMRDYTAPYYVHRVWQAVADAGPPTATTVGVNSTAYVAFNIIALEIDFDFFAASHFRIVCRGGSNAVGETIKFVLSRGSDGTNPAKTSSTEDLTLNNTQATYDSGWIARDDGQTGLVTYFICMKGSTATVDLTAGRLDVHWKIDS